MRNLLALLAAGVLGVAGLGWYLGWYHVQTTPTADGHRQINVDLNTKKISTDVSKGVNEGTHKVEEWLNKKDGTPVTVAPPRTDPPAPPPAAAQSRFRVNSDGSVSYTGEISVPIPFSQQTK